MNMIQRAILLVAVVAIILAGLFPPWIVVYAQERPNSLYWGFVIQEANQAGADGVPMGGTTYLDAKLSMDRGMLHSEWMMIVLITGGLLLAFQKRRADQIGS